MRGESDLHLRDLWPRVGYVYVDMVVSPFILVPCPRCLSIRMTSKWWAVLREAVTIRGGRPHVGQVVGSTRAPCGFNEARSGPGPAAALTVEVRGR